MKCPCCKTELKPWQMLRLETIDEHVCCCENISEKMAYICPMPGCAVNGLNPNTPTIYWNENGELYMDLDTSTTDTFKREYDYFKGIPWVDGNNAPFGSIQRAINVEVYKKDENKDLFIVPKWFPIRKGWRCERVWHYKSNEDGDILKRSSSLRWWMPSDHGTWTLHTSGFRMLRFELCSVWWHFVALLKDNNDKQAINQLKEIIGRKEWKNAEWWRYCGAFAAKCVLGLHNFAKG